MIQARDAPNQRQAGFVLPLRDRRRGRGRQIDHRGRADHRRHIRGADHRGVIAIDRRRLRDVQCLAGGHVGKIVDDDDARDEIDRRELARERAADVASSEDRDRAPRATIL